LILADEPTGNLDSRSSSEILELLEDIHSREGTTLVIVTHDKEIARRVGRVVMIRDGRLVPAPNEAGSLSCT
jgi:ABC-type lipoprotein export system ATPase subunit